MQETPSYKTRKSYTRRVRRNNALELMRAWPGGKADVVRAIRESLERQGTPAVELTTGRLVTLLSGHEPCRRQRKRRFRQYMRKTQPGWHYYDVELERRKAAQALEELRQWRRENGV